MSVRLSVRVQPGARRTMLKGRMADGTLAIAVSAPPDEGRANRALEKLLSGVLGVPARQVQVAKGHASRSKWVEIEGLGAAEVEQRIEVALKASEARHGE